MWDKSEKHLALCLLFIIAAHPITSWVAILMLIAAMLHAATSIYYSFKEVKND